MTSHVLSCEYVALLLCFCLALLFSMRVLLCIVISLSGDHSLYTFDLVYLLLFFPEEPRVPTSYNLHNHRLTHEQEKVDLFTGRYPNFSLAFTWFADSILNEDVNFCDRYVVVIQITQLMLVYRIMCSLLLQ